MKSKWTFIAVVVVAVLAVWPAAKLLAHSTGPGCSEPAKVVHPNGFGPESYARWKPKIGEPDSNGTTNFAMLLHHLTPVDVSTAARAVVAVEGFDGQDVNGFTLAYDHPFPTTFPGGKYSTCTMGGQAGNPRWSVRYQVVGTSIDNRFFFACNDPTMTDGIVTGTVSLPPTDEPLLSTGWER